MSFWAPMFGLDKDLFNANMYLLPARGPLGGANWMPLDVAS